MGSRLALLGLIAVVSLPLIGLAGQNPPAAPGAGAARAATWTPARTSWGDPDLRGIWNNATSTPLQRPGNLGDKAVLSGEEAEEFSETLADNLNRDRRDGGAEVDVNRAYNEHWMDPNRLKTTADRRTSLIVDPPDGRIPAQVPLSPQRELIKAAREESNRHFLNGNPYSYLDTALPVRCIIRTDRPPYLGIIYNNTYQIFQSPGYVVISPEMIHSSRVIPLDGRPHIGSGLKQWLGDSRGHFEGNTLVVETSNFRPDDGVLFGNADAGTFRIVERFTRVDASSIEYSFTIEDPRTWVKPWTAKVPWNKTTDQLFEYACHEDNFDMVHLLTGGRAREKAGLVNTKQVTAARPNEP